MVMKRCAAADWQILPYCESAADSAAQSLVYLKIVSCRASRRSPLVVPNQRDPQFISAVAH